MTADGERVHVAINVDDLALLEGLDPAHCDGIGLTRTEFLFQGRALPDEEQQYQAYRRIVEWAAGRPVIVRTLDAGGDKPVAGLTVDGERNPFLGLRGLRLSLARPEVFRVQLRALARAATRGDLKIMLPMVTLPRELEAARAMLEEVVADLRAAGIEAAMAPLGMMVEVPAAALTATTFAADFYSIGSNDLVQYVMAASRDNPAVAPLYDARNPAVHALIRQVVKAAGGRGVEASLCGELASDPMHISTLLRLGLRRLSVTPGPARAGQGGDRRLAARAMTEATARVVDRAEADRDLQAHPAHLHRPPTVRHAAEDRAHARQAQKLRLADHQSLLCLAGAGAASERDLRDLPLLARGAEDLSWRLCGGAPQGRAETQRAHRAPTRLTTCASACRSSTMPGCRRSSRRPSARPPAGSSPWWFGAELASRELQPANGHRLETRPPRIRQTLCRTAAAVRPDGKSQLAQYLIGNNACTRYRHMIVIEVVGDLFLSCITDSFVAE